jgi:hypothetical protein
MIDKSLHEPTSPPIATLGTLWVMRELDPFEPIEFDPAEKIPNSPVVKRLE